MREEPTVQVCCAGLHGDARAREDISFELSVGANGRGAANNPKHTGTSTCIDHVHYRVSRGRASRGDQRGIHQEHPGRIGVAPAVESECSRQISSPRGNLIDARRERESNQIRRLQGTTTHRDPPEAQDPLSQW